VNDGEDEHARLAQLVDEVPVSAAASFAGAACANCAVSTRLTTSATGFFMSILRAAPQI
jgi:hypothetical protein